MSRGSGRLSTDVREDPLYFREEISPLHGETTYVKRFEVCLRLIRQWAQQEIDSGLMSDVEWNDILCSYVSGDRRADMWKNTKTSDRSIRVEVLGEPTDAPFKFRTSPISVWAPWYEKIEIWLRQLGRPPSEIARHYVLKMLITVRVSTGTMAFIGADLSIIVSYERNLSRYREEEKRLQIYTTITSEALEQCDLYTARFGVISGLFTLGCYMEARKSGVINDDVLHSSLEQAKALSDEFAYIGLTESQYLTLNAAARLCWQRYVFFKSVKLDEIFNIFEEMDNIFSAVCSREALPLTSQALKELGHTAIQGVHSSSVSFQADYSLPLTVATEDVALRFQAMQAAEPQSTTALLADLAATSEGRSFHSALNRLVSWVQRSKARTLTELTSRELTVPTAVLDDISKSSKATVLLQREAQLRQCLQTATFDSQVRAQEDLDICLAEMRNEPALQPLMQFYNAPYSSFGKMQELLEAYGPDVVLVDWYHCNWRNDFNIYVQIYRLGEWSVPHYIRGIKMQDVQSWVNNNMTIRRPFEEEHAKAFAELGALLTPLEELTRPGETLVMCPVQVLHQIPLHALPVAGGTLIDRNPVLYCQSFAHLRSCLNSAQDGALNLRSAAALCPLQERYPNSEETRPIPALLSCFQSTFPDITIKHASPLAKEEVIESLQNNNLVLLLGHMTFNYKSPMQSAFCLTNDDEESGSKSHRLTAAEVFNLRLPAGAIALLIGCQSGVSNITKTGDILGLGTAFFFAGVSSIVSTLWRIDDRDAVAFCIELLSAWRKEAWKLQTKNSPSPDRDSRGRDDGGNIPTAHAPALVNLARAVQQAILRVKCPNENDKEEPVRAAYCWAAFTLNGSWLCRTL